MLLSDGALQRALILEVLTVHPWDVSMLQPASIDLRLGDVDQPPLPCMDLNVPRQWRIEAGQFVLACTKEIVGFPTHFAGRVEGKSTWGRRGLLIHAAGFVDPGFTGQLTLELKNLSHRPIQITEGDFVAQLAVWELDAPALQKYGDPKLNSHYQGQTGITHARS
jgi:dCTP deaminase